MARVSNKKSLPIGILSMLAIAYIAFGDAFLPGQAGYYSTYARATMNNMLVNIFPAFRSKTNPYQRTEAAIEREEKGQ